MMVARPPMILLLALIIGIVAPSHAQNVVGIDFGSEWIKLAVVQRGQGAGISIVFNEASKRKSPNVLAFEDTERVFGDTALVKAHKAMTHTRELLGKGIKSEILKGYGPHYFPFEIIEDEERGAIKIKEGDRMLSPELLAAMVLTYAKMLAQNQIKEKVTDCVITVPAFFRQFERQALLDAAQIAGLNVLSLMNDHTAVALKYAIDHNVATLTEPQNVLFYDMGATSTKAALVQFSAIEDKESFQKNKTLGQLKVLGVTWDETLGGHAFTSVVAGVLQKKSKKDPSKDKKAMAKLIQTAEKTKIILSANKNAHPSIESFIDDYDFRASIDRAEFEQEAKKLFERVEAPIQKVLAAANMTKEQLHKVEVIGGGWRIPKVQDHLLTATGKKQLDKTMNSDEAFCFGAGFYAASLSTAFRLRKYGVHDMTVFAVSVFMESMDSNEVSEEAPEEDEEGVKGSTGENATAAAAAVAASSSKNVVKLFHVGHKIPSKRLLSFKRNEDFGFTVQYDEDVPKGTPKLLTRYNITGVKEAIDKYPQGSKPKIHVGFRLTRSGLVAVDKAEALIEEMVEREVCDKVKKAKKNDTNPSEDGGERKEATDEEEKKEEKKEEEEKEKEKEEEKEKEDAGGKGVEKKEEGGDKEVGKESDDKDKKKKEDKKKKQKKDDQDEYDKVCKMVPEKVQRRVLLKYTAETPALKPFSPEAVLEARKVLKDYEEREEAIRKRASAFNALESYIYVTKEKLENNEDVRAVTMQAMRDSFDEQLTKMSSWLEDDGWEAQTDVLVQKLNELKDVGDPIFFRSRELHDRPEAVKKVKEYLQTTLDTLANLTKTNTWLNESHTQIVTNRTDQIYEWLNNKTEAQEKLEAWDTPAFSADEAYRRLEPLQELYRRVARIPKPQAPKAEKKKKAEKKSGTDADNATDAEKAEDAEVEMGEGEGDDGGKGKEDKEDKVEEEEIDLKDTSKDEL